MKQGKEVGGLQIKGSPFDTNDRPLQGFIRKMFAQLRMMPQFTAGLKATGQASYARTLADGTRIQVQFLSNPTGGEPFRRVQVTSPSVAGVGELVSTVYFENGLLIVNDTDNILQITLGDDLLEFFQSAGVADGVNFVHVQEGVVIDDPLLQIPFTPPFPETPYDSYLYNTERISGAARIAAAAAGTSLSSSYTGLMRFAVQSWLSVGRAPTAVCPMGPIQPNYDGLIYDSEYRFWWVRIGTLNTITYAPLYNLPLYEPIRLKLAAGGMEEVLERKYLMILISYLYFSADDEHIEDGDSGLGTVMSHGSPLVYGWKYNREEPWQASIVLHQTDWDNDRHLATLARIDFSIGGTPSVPSASSVVVESDVPYTMPAVQPFWYYSDTNNSWCHIPNPLGFSYEGTDVPLYCFYTSENVLQITRHTRETITNEPYLIGPVIYEYDDICGLGYSDVYRENGTQNLYGGFSIDGSPVFTNAADQDATVGYKDREAIEVFTTYKSGSNQTVSQLNSSSCGSLITDPGVFHTTFAEDRLLHLWGAIANFESYSLSREAAGMFAQVPIHDAEAILFVNPGQTYTSQVLRTTWTPAASCYTDGIGCATYSVEVEGWRRYDSDWILVAENLGSNEYAIGPPVAAQPKDIDYSSDPEATVYSNPMYFYTSIGMYEMEGPTDRKLSGAFASATEPCQSKDGAGAIMAYRTGGRLTYTDIDPVEIDGYDFVEPADSYRWIGDT